MYEERLKSLNKSQLQAVKTLEGPLLVLAGPGTGKTTLLTMRVAYILKNTDTLPESILCLTFTESAQKTMQSRLVNLLGQDAYKVQIHTFHSFGAWVMRVFPQYFETLIGSQLADDITRYQIFQSIFQALNHHDPLAITNDGDYIYLGDTVTRISQLKQAAITPERLLEQCEHDKQWVEAADKHIQTDLADIKVISKGSVSSFEKLRGHLESLVDMSEQGRACYLELRDALDDAQSGDKVSTKPITAWKNSWLTKQASGSFGLTYASHLKKLNSLAKVYQKYQRTMHTQGLTDYDDQLMLLLQGMRDQPDLLAELQERFLFLMADEYQDTNGVQQQILETLADNPIADGRPNIMVVGDDDQAIYGFQGAYSSNVLDFLKRWREVETITLTTNYRSTPEIVNFSRTIITQGENRLENTYEYIDKELSSPNANGTSVLLLYANSQIESYLTVAKNIQQDLASGIAPNKIVVLAPKHKYLERLVPYLNHFDIGVSYERRQDVLNEQHIHELLLLAEIVVAISRNQHTEVDTKLPELLSFPWWHLESEVIWSISMQAYSQKQPWLTVMKSHDDERIVSIAEWLIEQGKLALHTPLELMLDYLSGHGQHLVNDHIFTSPYYRYYFVEDTSDQDVHYLLTSLLVIRQHIRNFVGKNNLVLDDFIRYCDLRRQSNLPIINDHPLTSKQHAVHLMTAHRSKGLEFESVYLLDSQHSVWAKPRGRSSLIVMPPHIAAVPSGESSDEYLRLFYVALTRAARKLTLVSSTNDDNNNPVLPIGWLQAESTQALLTESTPTNSEPVELTQGLTFDWHDQILTFTDANWRDRLQGRLQNYRLSPTHLSTFLDVTNGGPRNFLINYILRFPQAPNPNIAFGNAMHRVMQFLHNEMLEHTSLPSQSATLDIFKQDLSQYLLGEIEESKQINRGEYAIQALYQKGLNLFKDTGQISEVDMRTEDISIGTARLTGKIDLLDTERGCIKDYKTGKPVLSWPRDNAKTYDALKLHRYKQQLLFYKLMTTRASNCQEYDLREAELVFLESGDHTDIQTLSFEYDFNEVERLERLIQVVWEKIMKLDLPDITKYPQDVTGIRAFEEDLLNGN